MSSELEKFITESSTDHGFGRVCIYANDLREWYAQQHSGMVLIDRRHLDAIISTLPGCSDHGCIFNPKPAGAMGTNGGCHCLKNASRSQLTILSGRLSGLINAAQEQQ
jgi:hypothetical protein